MNNENDIHTAGAALAFYHPNAKGTGSAIRFTVEPASAQREGTVRMAVAKQATIASYDEPSSRATFDWAGANTVKLSLLEAAEMLMVFGGNVPALVHAGRDGLYHNAPAWTASVTMKRSEDPNRPGFFLGVGVTPKADPNARQYRSFAFWPAEAYALRAALLAKFGELAFGAL